MKQRHTLILLAVGAILMLGIALSLWRPFAYYSIEIVSPPTTPTRSSHTPARGVFAWRAVPVEYEIEAPEYTLFAWRGGERFPRVYFHAATSTGQQLSIAGADVRGQGPIYFYDVSDRHGELTITISQLSGVPLGREHIMVATHIKGVFFEHDAP